MSFVLSGRPEAELGRKREGAEERPEEGQHSSLLGKRSSPASIKGKGRNSFSRRLKRKGAACGSVRDFP